MLGDLCLTMAPAGHILGSAQIIMDYNDTRIIAAGDYKRAADPTCQPFQPVPCDIFITEATFGLPVFRQPDPLAEIARLLAARTVFSPCDIGRGLCAGQGAEADSPAAPGWLG